MTRIFFIPVAEAIFKIFKTELANHIKFYEFGAIGTEAQYYVNWYNYHHIHGFLGYLIPAKARCLTF
ncbi:IS3 family transposase [Paenibacillus sp. N3.4]|uniref:IS3 family transposase n=1 Tax=Paenibacillus sp. N3.4 TaxID=2603222 RepID=UPI0016500D0B